MNANSYAGQALPRSLLLPRSARRQFAGLVVSVAVCLATMAVGALLTAAGVRDWYPTLTKPAWTPPDWLFGPVWTALYLMMAVAAWLVWRRDAGEKTRTALSLFAAQLVLNAAWSGLFFALRSPAAAFADIVALWCVLAATVAAFARVSAPAAAILIPYLAWLTYATALNGAIWGMNP